MEQSAAVGGAHDRDLAQVEFTGEVLKIPVSEDMLGRIFNGRSAHLWLLGPSNAPSVCGVVLDWQSRMPFWLRDAAPYPLHPPE